MFSKASMYNIQCGVAYILIHCVFDSSIARKCMRADDEKQEINLVWPYENLLCFQILRNYNHGSID